MASSLVTVDVPLTRLTLTELHREIRRLDRARNTLPLGPARDAVIERQWAAHQARAHRLSLLTLRAGYSLI